MTIEKISDANAIIDDELVYNAATNEIIGAISDRPGTTHYKLVFTVRKSEDTTQELTYNLFLKR